jgi:hypothetical protein
MTFEADLVTTIKAAAPALGSRVYPDFAPVSTQRPYCTFQQIGGPSINPLDNTAPGVRLPDIQVNAWADTREQAMSLIRAIEAGMRAASAFHAHPLGEPVGDFNADVPVYGALQDFGCRHTT